jgi:hypothetical protein
MSKIYVYAGGAQFISIKGVCYKKTNNTGKSTVDSSHVIIYKTASDCKKAN